MSVRRIAACALLCVSLSTTSVSAAGVPVPPPGGSSNGQALFVVGLLAVAGLLGWSLTRNGNQGTGETVSSRSPTPRAGIGDAAPAPQRGPVLMEF